MEDPKVDSDPVAPPSVQTSTARETGQTSAPQAPPPPFREHVSSPRTCLNWAWPAVLLFHRLRDSAPDGSSPRVYVRLLAVGHRLKLSELLPIWYIFFLGAAGLPTPARVWQATSGRGVRE